MVYDLLIRTRYDRSEFREKFRFGIERLVKNKSYLGAFPLHDVRLAPKLGSKLWIYSGDRLQRGASRSRNMPGAAAAVRDVGENEKRLEIPTSTLDQVRRTVLRSVHS